MTAAVIVQSGDVSDVDTWFAGVVPGNGDTVIGDGYNLNIDIDWTIGDSPAATAIQTHDVNIAAIHISNGNLTIAEDGHLTARGNVILSNGQLIKQPGCHYEFDSSQATDPLNQEYYLLISKDWNNANTWVQVNGTDVKRCRMSSNAGGGHGYTATYSIPIGANAIRGGRFIGEYIDFERVGSATKNSISPAPTDSLTNIFSLKNFTMNDCGRFAPSGGLKISETFIVENGNFKNSIGVPFQVSCTTAKHANASRSIQYNSFDENVVLNSIQDFETDGNIFVSGYTGTNLEKCASMDLCFIRKTTQAPINAKGDLTNSIVLKDAELASIENPHFLAPLGLEDTVITGCVFEMIGTRTGDIGDCIVGPTSGTATTAIEHNIFTRDDCTSVSLLGAAGQTYIFNHNTSSYPFHVNETYPSHEGMLSSFKSNIVFGAAPDSHYMLNDIGGGAIADIVAGANLDYNCDYNLIEGDEDHGINTPITDAHSANSITANPQFVNSDLDMRDFDLLFGGPGTVEHVVEELAKLNLPSHDSNFTVTNLLNFYHDIYAPTNTALENAGHDGVTIGAVELFVAPLGSMIGGVNPLNPVNPRNAF